MAAIIEKTELPAALQAAELIDLMIAGANSKASRVAPCLVTAATADPPTDEQVEQLAEAKLVLVGALKRWLDAGSGAVQQQTAGPFSMTTDTRQRTGWRLWPSEITDLQDICKDPTAGGLRSVGLVGARYEITDDGS